MLAITDIKVANIDSREIVIHRADPIKSMRPFCVPDMLTGEDIIVKQEVIDGQTFFNSKGEKVVIGWREDIQEALGLPFKAFEDMNRDNERLHREIWDLEKTIKVYMDRHTEVLESSFWKRLKFLFTRKI